MSPTSCVIGGTALLLTHLHSIDTCKVSFCSQICNTLRLCKTSHLTLFISNLLPGTCEQPRISPSPSLLQMPPSLLITSDDRPLDIFGAGRREGRGRDSSALDQCIGIEQELDGCSGCALGSWLIHPPSKPRVPAEELSSEATQLLAIFRKCFPRLLSLSCSRKSFLGHFIKKKSTKQQKTTSFPRVFLSASFLSSRFPCFGGFF